MMGTYLGVDCVLIVLIASTFSKVFEVVFELDWDIRWYIAATIPFCLLIGEIRQLKFLVPFSAIANFCLIITFGITLYYVFDGPLPIGERPLFSSWSQLPLYFRYV